MILTDKYNEWHLITYAKARRCPNHKGLVKSAIGYATKHTGNTNKRSYSWVSLETDPWASLANSGLHQSDAAVRAQSVKVLYGCNAAGWVGTTLSGRTSIAVSRAYTVPHCNTLRCCTLKALWKHDLREQVLWKKAYFCWNLSESKVTFAESFPKAGWLSLKATWKPIKKCDKIELGVQRRPSDLSTNTVGASVQQCGMGNVIQCGMGNVIHIAH